MALKVFTHKMRYKPALRRKVLAFAFVVSWLTTGTTLVSGLNFTLSKTRVILGTTGKLFMTCDVTETDASLVYIVQIRREARTGWETLAYIGAGAAETPALNSDIVSNKEFGVGGILDKNKPLNTHLSLEMKIEKMTYDDARVYRCEMTYKSKTNGSTVSTYRNKMLVIIDNTQQSSKSDNGNSTVGAILGVTNILTVVYAAYVTVVIRRSRTRLFDVGNLCHRRREPDPTATVAKRDLAVDQQTYSVNDNEDTYDLSK